MLNKILGSIFSLLFIASIFFGVFKFETFSPMFSIIWMIFLVVTGSLSAFFFIQGHQQKSVTSPMVKKRPSWVDFVPMVCVLLGVLIYFAGNVSSHTKELHALSHPLLVVFLLNMIVALVFCIVIAVGNEKTAHWRVINALGALILLFMVCAYGFMLPWMLACQPGAGSC